MSDDPQTLAHRFESIRTQADSPIIRWSVLAMGMIAVWVWCIEPLQIWKDDLHEQVARSAERTARLIAIEDNADRWIEARVEAGQALSAAGHQLLAGTTDTQSQAFLQTTLQQIAEGSGLMVEAQKLLSPEPIEGVGMQLAVELSVRGALVDLLYFLGDVSRSEKLLVIDYWTMQMQKDGTVFARTTITGFRPGAATGE